MESALTITEPTKDDLIAALSWQVEAGADEALWDEASFAHAMTMRLADVINPGSKNTAPLKQPVSAVPAMPTQGEGTAPQPASEAPVPATSLAQIQTLEALKQAMADFDKCDLKRTASHLVFSDGNPAAKIMVIGEAPGRDEDRVGLPFVGKAGQMLDHMLASIGLSRDDVYITNILPWRPPGNRTPTSEEIAMMRPFVARHIQLMSPDVIFAVGGTSAKSLLQVSDGIMKLRGKRFDLSLPSDNGGTEARYPLLPSLHPAYLLRAPHHKALAFKDLLALRQLARAARTS